VGGSQENCIDKFSTLKEAETFALLYEGKEHSVVFEQLVPVFIRTVYVGRRK